MNNEPTHRCGWHIARSDDGSWIRISDNEIRFYLPQDLYADLDDEAFLELCKTKRGRQ